MRLDEYESWKSLANAIIIQACRDYLDPAHFSERKSIEKFIRSKYFLELSRGCIPPEVLIDFLHEEAKKNGWKKVHSKKNLC